jgi:hypothetical protein
MPKLPRISSKEAIQALERLGLLEIPKGRRKVGKAQRKKVIKVWFKSPKTAVNPDFYKELYLINAPYRICCILKQYYNISLKSCVYQYLTMRIKMMKFIDLFCGTGGFRIAVEVYILILVH